LAEPMTVADQAALLPASEDIERAAAFAREPFLSPGETVEVDLAPGTAGRRALDAALAELDAGATHPSVE
jgi:ribonuclease E